MFRNAYVVTALNPKSILFFVTFLPQFIDPEHPALMQFVILEATFLSLATLNIILWALLAGEIRTRWPATLRYANRIGGGFLIAAGILSVTLRRA